MKAEMKWQAFELIRADMDAVITCARSAKAMCAADAVKAVDEALQYAAAHLKRARVRLEGVISNRSPMEGEQELPLG